MNRRKLLKNIGVGATVSSIVGTVSGSGNENIDQYNKEIQKALQIERKRGEEAKEKFLKRKGYSYVSKEATKPISLGPNDNEESDSKTTDDELEPLSIDDPHDGGILVRISGMKSPLLSHISVHLTIKYKFETYCDAWGYHGRSYGENPKDAAGIMWNSRQNEYFELTDGGGESAVFAEGNASWYRELHSPTIGRTGFRFDDQETYQDWESDLPHCGTLNPRQIRDTEKEQIYAGQCGVHLDPKGGWDPDQRVVRAAYTHAHGSLSSSPSLGFSAGGPTISFSPEYRVNDDHIVTDDDGDNLEIYQSEIT